MRPVVPVFLMLALSLPVVASAHCQVPCGIYDDHGRVHQMLEDVSTIRKAGAQIEALVSKSDALSVNQTVRWIQTKESHASHIQKTIAEYFLTQKIKPADSKNKKAWAGYLEKLADHHRVMRLAMKAKQTVDPKVVDELEAAVKALEAYWPRKG